MIEGLKRLNSPGRNPSIVILCEPIHYIALSDFFEKNKIKEFSGISAEKIDLDALLNEMKPFIQKTGIMQSNYELPLT